MNDEISVQIDDDTDATPRRSVDDATAQAVAKAETAERELRVARQDLDYWRSQELESRRRSIDVEIGRTSTEAERAQASLRDAYERGELDDAARLTGELADI